MASPLTTLHLFLSILWLNVITHSHNVTASSLVSISAAPGFSDLRACATCCLGCCGLCYGGDALMAVIQCSVNACICRTDLVPLAMSHISSCVSSMCQDQNDITSYQAVYQAYCSMTGDEAFMSATPAANPIPGVGGGVTVTRTQIMTTTAVATAFVTSDITLVPAIVTVTALTTYATTLPDGSVSTVTNNVKAEPVVTVGGGSSSSPSGLQLSDRIALGVGIGIGLPTFLAAMFFGYLGLKKRGGPRSEASTMYHPEQRHRRRSEMYI